MEVVDSMLSERNLTAPVDLEGEVRLRILNRTTDRWGVLGDGVSIVWFEVLREGAAMAIENDREELL